MYIYIYTCMHIYTYMYSRTYIYMYIYIYTCIHIYIHIYMYVVRVPPCQLKLCHARPSARWLFLPSEGLAPINTNMQHIRNMRLRNICFCCASHIDQQNTSRNISEKSIYICEIKCMETIERLWSAPDARNCSVAVHKLVDSRHFMGR